MKATPSPSPSFLQASRIPKPRYSYSTPHNKHKHKHKLPTSHFSIRLLASQNPTNSCPQNAHYHDPGNSNLLFWTATEIAEAVNGRVVKWGPPGTISTDTRTLEPNQWFFAIAGQNFDAHDFISPELSEKGCVGVIGNRVCENWEKGFVEINGDTVSSLMKMAYYARNRFNGAVVGVTGSVGKTTTKSMIALALESLGNPVYQSPGNWNTRIGVALSLIGIPRNAGVVVLEMGMSTRGEILELARMARPSIRVILNVGASHLENFSSLEEVAMAKGEILANAKPGDVCVLNADDPLVMSLPIPYGVKKVSELSKYLISYLIKYYFLLFSSLTYSKYVGIELICFLYGNS